VDSIRLVRYSPTAEVSNAPGKASGSAYVELMEQLIKRYLPLMNARSPLYHVISHYNLDYD
jgi:hypothetical protein